MVQIEGIVQSGAGFDAVLVKRSRTSFTDEAGNTFFPGSLNLRTREPIRFANPKTIAVANGTRTYVPALLNGNPVVVSHRHPMRPAARRRVLVFSTTRLRDALGLQDGSLVTVEFEDDALCPVTARDRLELFRYELSIAVADQFRHAKALAFDAAKSVLKTGTR